MPFKGVMFDMDGLLLDTERLVVDCFQKTTADLGLDDMSNVVMRLIGLRSDACEGIVREALKERIPIEVFNRNWEARIKATLERGIPLKDGVIDLLEQLYVLGKPCVVATSTNTTTAKKHLEMVDIAHYFQTVTGGEQVKHGKPAPDIYHKAALSIGLQPQDCVAFEDSDPGTIAAITSGATTVQIPDINPPAPEMYKLGHVIAETILEGADQVGLL